MSEISNPRDCDKPSSAKSAPIANLIRRMGAKGFAIEAIAMAVEAMEFDRDEKQAHRREQNRIYQQNHRARQHDGADKADTSLSSSTPSIGKPLSEEVRKEDVSVAGREFWQRYPLRIGKRAAMLALEKALKRASLVEILAGVDRYKASANPDYYCHPSTWLNADRWLDEPKLQRIKGNGKGLAELAHDLAEEYHDEFESNSSGPANYERRS